MGSLLQVLGSECSFVTIVSSCVATSHMYGTISSLRAWNHTRTIAPTLQMRVDDTEASQTCRCSKTSHYYEPSTSTFQKRKPSSQGHFAFRELGEHSSVFERVSGDYLSLDWRGPQLSSASKYLPVWAKTGWKWVCGCSSIKRVLSNTYRTIPSRQNQVVSCGYVR